MVGLNFYMVTTLVFYFQRPADDWAHKETCGGKIYYTWWIWTQCWGIFLYLCFLWQLQFFIELIRPGSANCILRIPCKKKKTCILWIVSCSLIVWIKVYLNLSIFYWVKKVICSFPLNVGVPCFVASQKSLKLSLSLSLCKCPVMWVGGKDVLTRKENEDKVKS